MAQMDSREGSFDSACKITGSSASKRMSLLGTLILNI